MACTPSVLLPLLYCHSFPVLQAARAAVVVPPVAHADRWAWAAGLFPALGITENAVRKLVSSPHRTAELLQIGIKIHTGSQWRETAFLTQAGLFRVCGSQGIGVAGSLYEWATIIANPPGNTIPLSSREMGGIYLLQIGTVEKLRTSMALPGEVPGTKLVVKFGLTKDLARRFGEHERHFGVLPGAEIKVVKLIWANEDELEEAEALVKSWFEVAAEPLQTIGPETLRGGGAI
ncbi:hypothetical protein HDU86_002184 [Geranomyces michiganensis]|nr:hypothetical protein HDU86_002184 [Geranomyces michiganensis]